MSDAVALAAIVILLFPMGYFFLASPAFLLVKLDIPEVSRLLRGMFNAHFLMLSIAGVIGTIAFVVTGHLASSWASHSCRNRRRAQTAKAAIRPVTMAELARVVIDGRRQLLGAKQEFFAQLEYCRF